MIEITIRLDTEMVEASVKNAWQKAFLLPDRFGNNNDAYGTAEVKRQVAEYIATIDVSAIIARVAKAKIDDVVNEVVTVALREKAKQRAKEMMREGTLLGDAQRSG